jgi:hypothetical protein
MSSAIFQIASSLISSFVVFRSTWKRTSITAGPEQKAEARNRGARIEAFQ